MWLYIKKLLNLFHLHSFYKFEKGSTYDGDVKVRLCENKYCAKFEVEISSNSELNDEELIEKIKKYKEELVEEKQKHYTDKQRRAWLTKQGLA